MRKLFRLLTLALLFLAGANAYAVPARSITRQYTQPDGSTVTLRLVGDEFSHFYLTDDDQIVVSRNGVFYFAEPSAQGYPVASKVLASNQANRTAEARALLSSAKKETMIKASDARRAAKMKEADRQRTRLSAPAKATAANWPSGIGLFPNNTYPVTGSPNAVIILVQFKDQAFTLPNAKQYFTDFASKEGFNESGLIGGTNTAYNAHGSAYDYFKACSNGQFTPNFHVLGPVTLPNNMAYYGGNDSYGNDKNPHLMVLHAVQALDATTDFSIFDTDNDGYIDNVYVIYSGQGEANGGSDDTVWPHSWSVYSGTNQIYRFDGKILDSYACSAEVFAKSGSLTLADGIGTFCHEFSHVMGLPDLYQTEYNSSVVKLTPGEYSLMDQGSYNNNSRTPPTYSIYERNAMGWADVEVLTEGEGKNGVLEHMLTSNKGYAIRAGSDNEFFLLENRQQADWDEYLPGHGMLIWHINYDTTTWNNNAPNNKTQQCVDIVEAGGTANNENATTMKQYPFPGTKNVTSFTSSTTPALKSWSNKAIDVPLTNISEDVAKGLVTFDICGGASKLEAPVCNYTSSPVVSDTPITITLSKPASAPASAVIKYVYMDNDATEMLDGEYTAPVTISKSGEFEYWLEDGLMSSQVTNLKIYIGEQPDLEYTIVYTDSSSDSGTVISSSTYANNVEEGSDIATLGSASNVYPGISGLKFSSSKNSGSLTLRLSADYQLPYAKVIVKAKKFGSDAASLKVGSASQDMTADLADYTYDLDGSVMTSVTLSATKRLYVKSITFVLASGGEDPDPVVETVATPTFSVKAGEVEKGTTVEIACETEGASIYYTLDGTVPTAGSTLYAEALTITEDATVKAIAVKEGWNDSEVASAAYTVKPEQGGDDPQPTETSYTIVYKDSDNDTTTDLTANTYSNCVEEGESIAMFASCNKVYNGIYGLKFSSSKANGTITLDLAPDYQLPYTKVILKAVKYGSDAASLQIGSGASQDLTEDLADYTYDLDGSKVTSITLNATKRLYVKSITFVLASGGEDPDPVVETVATPTFSVKAGEVEKGTTVEIACATEGASIYYTLDGTAPTAGSTLYSEALTITEDVTVKAIAVKEGWNDSEVASAAYTVKPEQGGDDPQPIETSYTIVYKDSENDSTSDLTANTYSNCVEEGESIATFASCSKVYNGIYGLKFSSSKANGKITLDLAPDYQLPYTKVILKAVKYGSDAASLQFGSGASQDLTEDLADYTYDLDGSKVTSITLNATKRLYVKSITFVLASGGEDPDPVVETVATPTFSVEAGEVEQGTVVELACETEGATIHFTVDGTDPTAESDIYTDAILIEDAMTIKAIAMKEGWNDSEVATAVYTIKEEQGGDDPVEGDAYTVNFDFTSADVDNLYGMELKPSGYNTDGHICQEGPITLTLHGNTRWWDNNGRHLRLYSGAYITVSCPEPHDIQSVHLTVGNENHWDNTSHVSKVASVDFTTNHNSGNTILHKVEVNYITTSSIVDVDADANEAVYYNLQGIRVENPDHGVYIRVQGNKATKVVK